MLRKCLKCGTPNANATGDVAEVCPACGAIYSKVEAARAVDGAAKAPAAARHVPAPPLVTATEDVHVFAEDMRADSLYPTFRVLVNLVYAVWVALAIIAAVGGVASLFLASGMGARVGGLAVALVMALVFYLLARLTREMSLMLADLSDAAVLLAMRSK